MKKLLTAAATLAITATTFAYDSDDCDYRGNGGYNSPSCHVLTEERLDALEASMQDLEDFADAVDNGDFNGQDGRDGTDGADGKDGVDGINGTNGVDGIDGTNGKDGKDGRDGVDGKDGVIDYSTLRTVTRKAQRLAAQSAAIGSIIQSPHDRSGFSVACGEAFGMVECAGNITWAIEDSNSVLSLTRTRDITTAAWGYHFGK